MPLGSLAVEPGPSPQRLPRKKNGHKQRQKKTAVFVVFTTELHGAPHSSAGAGPPPLCSGGGIWLFSIHFPSFPDILAHPPPQGLVCDNGFPVEVVPILNATRADKKNHKLK